MKPQYKTLLSAALGPTMLLLYVALMYSTGDMEFPLILVHVMTIVCTFLLVSTKCCNYRFMFLGMMLNILLSCLYDTIFSFGFLKYLFTFAVTVFYVFPAAIFMTITIAVVKRWFK